MSFYMILDLQGFDRVLAVREWFRGSNFWGVTTIRGSNVDATIRLIVAMIRGVSWSLGETHDATLCTVVYFVMRRT